MPRSHTFHQLCYHFVWSTKHREPMLDAQVEACLYPFLARKCQELGYVLQAAKGTADHLHVLVELTPTMEVAEVAKNLKGACAFYINKESGIDRTLYWQDGYGVITLRQAEVPRVARYVQNQKQHHASGTVDGRWERTE